jgi:hypothetical protein
MRIVLGQTQLSVGDFVQWANNLYGTEVDIPGVVTGTVTEIHSFQLVNDIGLVLVSVGSEDEAIHAERVAEMGAKADG